jgi:hypothetical protein
VRYDVRFIDGESPALEEFLNLSNRHAQLLIPAPDNAEIHMDPLSIGDDAYESLPDDINFRNASPHTPLDNQNRIRASLLNRTSYPTHQMLKRKRYSGWIWTNLTQEPPKLLARVKLTLYSAIQFCNHSRRSQEVSQTSQEGQRSYSHYRTTLCREKGHTTDPQSSVRAIYAMPSAYSHSDPYSIDDAYPPWDCVRWRLVFHDELINTEHGQSSADPRTPMSSIQSGFFTSRTLAPISKR